MFSATVICDHERLDDLQKRFSSIFHFLSDECETAELYVYGEWVKQGFVESVRALPQDHPMVQGVIRKIEDEFGPLDETDVDENMPKVVYMTHREYSDRKIDSPLPVRTPANEFFYAPLATDECKAILGAQGLRSETAILVLAAAGIDVALPNISLGNPEADEIAQIKEKLEAERNEYLHAITAMADQAFDRLVAGAYEDVYDWARNEARFKITPSVNRLNQKLRMLDKTWLERARVAFWRDGIPVLGGLVGEQDESMLRSLGIRTVEVLSSNLAKSIEERRLPEAAYIVKLASNIQRSAS